MDDAAQAFLKSKIMDNIHNDVIVFVDVVHDFRFEEGLGGVVHNLVTQFGLRNVLSQLFDSGAAGLGSSIQINDLVSIVLSARSILNLFHQLLYNFKLSLKRVSLVASIL